MRPEAEVIPIEHAPSRARPERCRATTSSGRPCRNYAIDQSGYCRVHARPQTASAPAPAGEAGARERAVSILSGIAAFVRRRAAGDYHVDDLGYDPDLHRSVLLPLAAPLYERYFRVRTLGLEHVPAQGPAMLVANHSGTLPLDAVMLQYAVARHHPAHRPLRCVGADLVWRSPVVSHLARKAGNVVACDEDADALLDRGELMGVFPEGYKGVGKGWANRYRLQRFGRGGYMELALRRRVPLIPVAIVGAEEAYPMIGNIKVLARLLGLPYFPVTPTFPLLGPLGLVPLPSRWIIEFGEPVDLGGYPEDAAEDAMLVFDLSDRVRDRIQQMLDANLLRR